MKAWRAFAAEAAHTINSGHDDSAALRKLMTTSLAKSIGDITGSDVGRYYPGPVPLQPLGVVVVSATSRTVRGCLLSAGFSDASKTSKRKEKRKVIAVNVLTVKQSGRWIVDDLIGPVGFSCKKVSIRTQRW